MESKTTPTNNFIINSDITFSYSPRIIKQKNIIIECYSNNISINNLQMLNGLVRIGEYVVFICNTIPAGIVYKNNFEDFKMFGCLNNQITQEYLLNLQNEMDKFFLGMSGIDLYKNYILSYEPINCLELKDKIDSCIKILKYSNRNVN